MKATVVKILNNRVLYSYLLVGATLTNMQRLTQFKLKWCLGATLKPERVGFKKLITTREEEG